MEKFFEKLSSYHLLNTLIPGALLAFLLDLLGVSVFSSNIVNDLLIFYLAGLVGNRVGALLVEPISKKTKWVMYSSHTDYVSAEKGDPTITTLSETNNMYRTIIACLVLALLVKLYLLMESHVVWLENYRIVILIAGLFVLFSVSYRRMTKFIKSRVDIETAKSNDSEEQGR